MATTAPYDIGELISSTPGVQGGKPCITGTRTTVRTIAVCHMQGMTPKKMLKEFPHLGLAEIYAALAYYHANKVEIESDLEVDARLGERMAAKYPNGVTGPIELP